MDLDSRDLVWRSLPRTCGRRIVRHKGQKSFRSVANTDSQTPEEENDAYSIAYAFAKTKESFAESDAQGQIEAEENISYCNSERVTICDRNSVTQSGGNTRTCTREERLAERLTIA